METPETQFPHRGLGGPITLDQMYNLFTTGVVGTKEFRNWLAAIDPTFAEVRDADVDNEIDRIARERSAERHSQESDGA
jgi:hypothetical protein